MNTTDTETLLHLIQPDTEIYLHLFQDVYQKITTATEFEYSWLY